MKNSKKLKLETPAIYQIVVQGNIDLINPAATDRYYAAYLISG